MDFLAKPCLEIGKGARAPALMAAGPALYKLLLEGHDHTMARRLFAQEINGGRDSKKPGDKGLQVARHGKQHRTERLP